MEQKIAILKIAAGGEPDRFMQQLIQYGLVAGQLTVPTVPGISLGFKGDQVGHIVGRQFGGFAGEDNGIGNVFPQNPSGNNRDFNSFETGVVKPWVEGGCNVCVKFTFYFDKSSNTPHRPANFDYEWWVNGIQMPTKSINNPAPRNPQ